MVDVGTAARLAEAVLGQPHEPEREGDLFVLGNVVGKEARDEHPGVARDALELLSC
ncbi:hypothetical protein [Frankia sp. Cj3]|uniref:hypothetical protein n=1 Tax=Frankia sp. Cj3 TaxID=2880976 RepID=UPI001EF4877D|nr:hypothetical protein [Frankia sp. Cj3]